MTSSVTQAIGTAVHENRPLTLGGISDRVFARLFRGLVYAQIWEDPVADMTALELTEADHIVCIASGGCNMMSYLTASPSSITAVDLSPAHVHLNRLKLLAAENLPDHATFYALFGKANRAANIPAFDRYLAPHLDDDAKAFWNGRTLSGQRKAMFRKGLYRFGVLGRFLGAIQTFAWVTGVDLRRLLKAQTLEDQKAFFEAEISPLYEARLVRFLARRRSSLFGLGIPPAQYDKLAADAGGDVIPVLRERTRRLFCDFPISENYFAWQAIQRSYKGDGTGPVPPYLEARHFDTIRANAGRVQILNQSVTDMLAEQPSAAKSVYVLLDAQDWMSDEQLNALWSEITRTAMPGARVLFRTGGADDILPGRVGEALLDRWEYDADASRRAFENDRSAIYGGVHLYRLKG
ncbi:DUF3419 family protein [Aestuariibius sp. 2305UL40-4]|uniref:DUF3419 family protein n=1 Tax=Aestuariibius violaceus TaxID=3234132 RepID=UPI0034785F14